MKVCGNCGYRRQDSDGGALGVCPKCDMPYEWAAARVAVPKKAERKPASDGVVDTIIFAIVLALGCFLPLMSVPIVGSVTATQLRFSDGYVLLALAGVAVWLAHSGKVATVRVPGFLAVFIVFANFAAIVYEVQTVKADMRKELVGNPFAGLAEAMVNSMQLQLGWVPLAVGAIGLVAVGYGKRLPIKR